MKKKNKTIIAWTIDTPYRQTFICSIRSTKSQVFSEWKSWGVQMKDIIKIKIER